MLKHLIKFYIFKFFERYSDYGYSISQFIKYHGRMPNLVNPRKFSDKLFIIKLEYRISSHQILADKLKFKEWCERNEIKHIPTLASYNNTSEINWQDYENRNIVIKTNHDSGTVFAFEKFTLNDVNKIKKTIDQSLKLNYYNSTREWQYFRVSPKIIIEPYIEHEVELKFHCSKGKILCIYVAIDRSNRDWRQLYDENWSRIWGYIAKENVKHKFEGHNIDVPERFDELKQLVSHISRNIDYVRLDFLIDSEQNYLMGEWTHCHGGALDKVYPIELDEIFGKKLLIS